MEEDTTTRQVASTNLKRVKVYRLNDIGRWDDQGTGHVTFGILEGSKDTGLFVIDEEDNETLLLHRISAEDIYRKQEDTIISWKDSEYSTELALSFQEAAGCSFVWDHICNVQRSMQFTASSSESLQRSNVEIAELPAVECSTLPSILKLLSECGPADQMRIMDLILSDKEFFQKLVDLFRMCEDLESFEDLYMICKIVKAIISLNNIQLMEKLFADELIMDVIGSLEYDPDIPRVQHRNFIKEHVVFKEVIPIGDPLVQSKIHQTYRIGYLKDVILARILDEAAIASINSIIQSNNAIIVSFLKDDHCFIQELFARLRSTCTSAESKRNLFLFLHELCSLSKSLQMIQQIRLLRDLADEGIFDIITDALRSRDAKVLQAGTDILIIFLSQDPGLPRSCMFQGGASLLCILVEGITTDVGEDMHYQFLEILRCLLASGVMGAGQRDNVIEFFYANCLSMLVDIIKNSCPESATRTAVVPQHSTKSEGDTVVKPGILSSICELLCFCISQHPYKIKSHFLPNDVISKVLLLTQRREKYLIASAIRFVRTVLGRQVDEHLMDHFVKKSLFKPIVDTFIRNGHRYNLLHSAILELFDHIRKENMKTLVKHIVDSFWNDLSGFEQLAPIRSVKVKYDQMLDNSRIEAPARSMLESRRRADARALEKEEEDYFNEENEEGPPPASDARKARDSPATANGVAPSRGSTRVGLVDYDDDEDDEDYVPPPKKPREPSDDDDEGLESKLKRGTPPREDPGHPKKQRLGQSIKVKDGIFVALRNTLSHAALPGKSPEPASPPQPGNQNDPLEENSRDENGECSRSCSDSSRASKNSDEATVVAT